MGDALHFRFVEVPPSKLDELVHQIIVEAPSDFPSGVARHDGKWPDVTRNDGPRPDHRPIADRDAAEEERAVPDPNVVSNRHRTGDRRVSVRVGGGQSEPNVIG